MNSFILRERDRHLPTLYIPKKGLASLRHKMVLGKQIERMRVTIHKVFPVRLLGR